jgi:hypothetical protein
MIKNSIKTYCVIEYGDLEQAIKAIPGCERKEVDLVAEQEWNNYSSQEVTYYPEYKEEGDKDDALSNIKDYLDGEANDCMLEDVITYLVLDDKLPVCSKYLIKVGW